MTQRSAAVPPYDDVVCDAPVAPDAAGLHVDAIPLPAPPRQTNRIVVFGDTGCRMKGAEQQNCATGWFFPQIARAVAAEHPDLILHVGDYYYRESNCVDPKNASCVNHWGPTMASWDADWFTPGAPMFAAAPMVLLRGNHEDCARGGTGWFRYLEPHDPTSCSDVTGPYAVALPDLRVVIFDSASMDDATSADPATLQTYRVAFQSAQALAAVDRPAHEPVWFATHRVLYTNVNAAKTMENDLAPFDAMLVGHTHAFDAVNVQGHPPLIVNGEGGDDIEDPGFIAGAAEKLGFAVAGKPFAVTQYGYAVYTRSAAGWDIALKDRAGKPLASCTLAQGSVHC